MNEWQTYLHSGILESYAMGLTSAEETGEVELLMAQHTALRQEVEAIRHSLTTYAEAHAIAPPPTVKPLLMAMVRYQERLKKGEAPAHPPILQDGRSNATEFASWLHRDDLQKPEDFNGFYAHIIGHTATALTTIVWIGKYTPPETHDDLYEKFLILEGSCTITIGDEKHDLVPGSCLTIPLHQVHYVKVTSDIPCKAILQRVAA